MTYDKAIELIGNSYGDWCKVCNAGDHKESFSKDGCSTCMSIAAREAVAALKKQIPKNIKKEKYSTCIGGFTLCVCPNCRTSYGSDYICKLEVRMYKFCPECGQSLNWDLKDAEEENDD